MTAGDVTVRGVSVQEIPDLVNLHLAAFVGFYLTALGPRFLARYYRKVIEYPGGICVGAFDGREFVGAAAGFVCPPEFYTALRADRVRLGLAALPALAADPRKAARFLQNYRRAGTASRRRSDQTTAELASLGVHPTSGGRGIGEQLVRHFISEARDRGALAVALTTDANGNDAVNRFYKRLGFHLDRQFEAQPGRQLNEYSVSTVSERGADA